MVVPSPFNGLNQSTSRPDVAQARGQHSPHSPGCATRKSEPLAAKDAARGSCPRHVGPSVSLYLLPRLTPSFLRERDDPRRAGAGRPRYGFSCGLRKMGLTQNAADGIARDHQLLVRRDDVGMQAGIVRTYLSLLSHNLLVLLLVQLQTRPSEIFANPTTNVGRVLSDPAGEDNHIRTAHTGKKTPDILSRAVAAKAFTTVRMPSSVSALGTA